jgi:hypothetical protein
MENHSEGTGHQPQREGEVHRPDSEDGASPTDWPDPAEELRGNLVQPNRKTGIARRSSGSDGRCEVIARG